MAEYQSLDSLLRGGMPLPAVQWDRLAEHLSSVIGEEEIPAAPALRISWRLRSAGLALAASVLIVIGIGIAVYRQQAGTGPLHRPAPAIGPVVVNIQGPSAEPARQPAVARISIGPANELAENQYQLSEGIVYQPGSVSLIASGDDGAQDGHWLPFQ